MVLRYGLLCICLLLPAFPVWGKTPFEAAQGFYESGRETEARRALRQELRLRPHNLEARYDLAVLLADIGHREEARQLYEQNLRLGRHLPSAVNLSMMFLQEGREDEARKLLLDTARRFRAEAVPWYLLAEIAAGKGHNRQAEDYYQQALKADPLNGFAHLRYARFLASRKRYSSALRHARRASRLLPDCAPCWRTLGDIQQQAGHPRQALAAYQHSAALRPDRATRGRIIAVLESMGENERAAAMRQALKALH